MKKNTLLKFTFLLAGTLLVGCGKEESGWDASTELGSINQDASGEIIQESTEEVTENNSENTKEESTNDAWTGEWNEPEIEEESTETDLSNELEVPMGEELDKYIGKTIYDLINDYQQLEEDGYSSFGENYTFTLKSKSERYDVIIDAECNEEEIDALGDIFDRETEDMYPLATIISIQIIDNQEVLEMAKQFIGKTVSEMLDAGYSIDGYSRVMGNLSLYISDEEGSTFAVEIGKVDDFDKENYKTLYLDKIINDVELGF
jgi:hypothetical protein